MKRLLKKWLLHKVFPMYYRHRRRMTEVKKLAVFVEIRYDRMTNNMRRLYEAYEQEGSYQVAQGFLMLNSGLFSYVRHCFLVIRLIAGAELIFVDESSNMLAALPIREETKMVQLWHGCGAFKKFGHGLDKGLEERYYNEYALVTVSSETVVDIYKKAMRQSGETVKALGVSRTDYFFDEVFLDKAREKLASLHLPIEGKKLVLYAPTFRGNVAMAKEPSKLDIDLLYERMSEEYVFLYKGHPAVNTRMKIEERHKDFIIDVTDLLGIEELLVVSDMCITDYSSLIFEYSLLEKPIFFYAYDYEEYCDERGFYYPYEEFVPGPICKTTEELTEAVLSYDEILWLDRVKAFRERFMDACDGHATERIMAYLERIL